MKKLKISGFDIAIYACFIVALYNKEYMAAIGLAQLMALSEIVESVKAATGAWK